MSQEKTNAENECISIYKNFDFHDEIVDFIKEKGYSVDYDESDKECDDVITPRLVILVKKQI